MFSLLRMLCTKWVVLFVAGMILYHCFLRPMVLSTYWWMRP